MRRFNREILSISLKPETLKFLDELCGIQGRSALIEAIISDFRKKHE